MGVEIMRGCMCVSGCVTRSRALMMKDVYQEPRTRKRSVLLPSVRRTEIKMGLLSAFYSPRSQLITANPSSEVRRRQCAAGGA